MQPLQLPPNFDMKYPIAYRICLWIPILGWILVSVFEKLRTRPIRNYIEGQLVARSLIPIEVWGNNYETQRFAEWVIDWIKQELRYPNKYFIPNDPMQVIFFDDDLDSIELIQAIEEFWDLSPKWSEEFLQTDQFCKVFEGSLGEFVDYFSKIIINKSL